MKTILSIIGILAIFIIACGPNKEEIAKREKLVADSVAKTKRVEDSLKEAMRIHLEKIEVGKSIKKTELNNILNELKSELEEANDKLIKIINSQNIPPIRIDRSKEISEQKAEISKIEATISKMEKEIAMTNLFNSFDFQLTPRGTIEHIFFAAKNKDFSKMRHLIDPYGEFEKETFGICYVEMLPSDRQDEWVNTFKNGRIMGEPMTNGDTAIVEIAIGLNSNKLEKMKLIRRMDKWYIIGM